MADVGPFVNVPLIFEGPSGQRHHVGRATLEPRTYRLLHSKLFHAQLVSEDWKKLLEENR